MVPSSLQVNGTTNKTAIHSVNVPETSTVRAQMPVKYPGVSFQAVCVYVQRIWCWFLDHFEGPRGASYITQSFSEIHMK